MNVAQRIRSLFGGKPKTGDYRSMGIWAFRRPRELPIFSFDYVMQMLYDPTIRLGLAMRAAPLQQAEFAYEVTSNDGNSKWVPGIQADNPNVGTYVLKQLKRIWKHELHKMLLDQVWGWSGGEVTFKQNVDGNWEVDEFLHRSALHTYAIVKYGQIVGVQIRSIKSENKGYVDLPFPAAFWSAFNPESESPYGRSILLGAFSPWCDKWLNGGALDTRRLFAHKDAYGGVDIGYPPDGTYYIDGQEIPARDIAREMAEQLKAGGVTVRPSIYDSTGKELWTINRATVPANPAHIFEYPKDLDTEILRGMEIPDDVLTSEATGAWQGKQVPMQAFFTNADRWLSQIVKNVTVQILEPLVLANFGKAEDFEVSTKPLALQAMEQIAADEPKGAPSASGGRYPVANPFQQGSESSPFPVTRRFGLEQPNMAEEMVGVGVVQASQLVEAGRKFLEQTTRTYIPTPDEVARLIGLNAEESTLLRGMTKDNRQSNGKGSTIAKLFGLDDRQGQLLRTITNGRN